MGFATRRIKMTPSCSDELCGWCGLAPCVWNVYEAALRKTANRMHDRPSRRRRNKSLRKTLGRVFIYLQTGRMHGVLPACATKKLQQIWPDKVRRMYWIFCYSFCGSFSSLTGVIVLFLRFLVKATGSRVGARAIASNASCS